MSRLGQLKILTMTDYSILLKLLLEYIKTLMYKSRAYTKAGDIRVFEPPLAVAYSIRNAQYINFLEGLQVTSKLRINCELCQYDVLVEHTSVTNQ
jgi:hypothetical protein